MVTYKIDTLATTNEEISVEVSDYCDFVEFLDVDPEGIDASFVLLDTRVTECGNPSIEKLYKVPANEIFPAGFVVMFVYYPYNFLSSEGKAILFPSDFEDSAYITSFEDLRYLHWYSEEEINFLIWN